MAQIAILGGTGNVGQRLVAEALRRGHSVTVIGRKAPATALPQGVTFVQGDVTAQTDALAKSLAGTDLLITAARFADVTADQVLALVREAGIPRLLVVGGAGSLEVAPGKRLVDTPEFPDAYKSEALPGADFLDTLRGVTDVDWSFLSPAAMFGPGKRTGTFRLGGDQLLVDASGDSRISYEDFALALLDEVDTPRHSRARFTIAY